jgi:osmotically-inducible protein OsmY
MSSAPPRIPPRRRGAVEIEKEGTMKTSAEVQRDVLEELEFDPSLDSAAIGVAVDDGVVTLSGHVPTYAHRAAAERAARRIAGVRAVADELRVELAAGSLRDDTDIAQAAVAALEWSLWVPEGAVRVVVDKGWVTLEGALPWKYQKDAAYHAVEHLTGVKGVSNLIALKPVAKPVDVERRIQGALQRAASLDAKKIHVETIGGRVILRGTVRSFAERDDAERAAWSAAGVSSVDNEIAVGAAAYAAV